MSKREIIFTSLMVFALGLVVVVFNRVNSKSEFAMKTETRMTLVAEQLIRDQFQTKKFIEQTSESKTGRGLASAVTVIEVLQKNLSGEFGRDPQGRPFRYSVSGQGQAGDMVTVYAAGLDGQFQTEMGASQKVGDDILMQYPVK